MRTNIPDHEARQKRILPVHNLMITVNFLRRANDAIVWLLSVCIRCSRSRRAAFAASAEGEDLIPSRYLDWTCWRHDCSVRTGD